LMLVCVSPCLSLFVYYAFDWLYMLIDWLYLWVVGLRFLFC
jgi:hypothetical protein